MVHYKERLTKDLDSWIEAGLVERERRQAILDTVPDARRLDAATALAWVGGVLFGAALIAFVAANWDAIARVGRFAFVLAVFLAFASGAALAAHRNRNLLSNVLLTASALAFAAAIGLTGQIFDIAGDPRAALRMSGVAAAALALAGRSTGAAMASLIFFVLGDIGGFGVFDDAGPMPWTVIAAPIGAALALRWRSAPLAHAAALGLVFAFAWIADRLEPTGGPWLFLSVWLALLAASARHLRAQGRDFAAVFYGWFAWAALLFFAVSGQNNEPLFHRAAWIIASAGAIALGRFDRHTLVTAAGVVSLITAIAAVLMDLGLDLLGAAAVFFVCALVALIVGLLLRRRAKA